jgi:hypothetical protein
MSTSPVLAAPRDGLSPRQARKMRGVAIARLATRLALCLGLVAALPVAAAAEAGAAPLHSDHHGAPPGRGAQGGQPGRGGSPDGDGRPGGGDHNRGGAPGGGEGWSHHRHITVSGTVGTLGTSSFTLLVEGRFELRGMGRGPVLTGTATTLTVDVSTTGTRFVEPTVKSADFSDVLSGDQVRVEGALAGQATVNANVVNIPLVKATGTVGTIGASSFELSVPSRGWDLTGTATTLTINTSGAVFREPTVPSASLSNVMTGDKVSVRGTQEGAGTVDATWVFIPLAVEVGKVDLVSTSSFTMSVSRNVTVTVNVSSSTRYREPGQSQAGFNDVGQNDHVLVLGTQGGANTVDALTVVINPSFDRGRHGRQGS